MKSCSVLLAVCLIVLASPAWAEKTPTGFDGGAFVPAGECPTDGYKPYTAGGGEIPDGDGVGVFFGPAVVPDVGEVFVDVVVDVEMNHTWVGDLIINAHYDDDCDRANGFAASVNLICRPGSADCTALGCNTDVNGIYRFSDDGGASMGDACLDVGTLGAGCYASNEVLSAFDGLEKGGCFWLEVSDNAGADVGSIGGIVFWANNEPVSTPVERTSWGQIKSTY